MASPRVACRPISSIDPDSSSVAVTVASMRCAVSVEADEAAAMRPRVSSAAWFNVTDVVVSEPDASLIAATTSPMALAKSAIASSMTLRRANAACSALCRCSVMALATSKLTTLATIEPYSATLAEENRYLRASAASTALST